MLVPDYCVCNLLLGRYARLGPTLVDIRASELVRFIDNSAAFAQIFPPQDYFLATLFHEEKLNAFLKSFKEANSTLTTYYTICDTVRNKRTALQGLCTAVTTDALLNAIREIEVLEKNQSDLLNMFYAHCNSLYPCNNINCNTTQCNNIQHVQ